MSDDVTAVPNVHECHKRRHNGKPCVLQGRLNDEQKGRYVNTVQSQRFNRLCSVVTVMK